MNVEILSAIMHMNEDELKDVLEAVRTRSLRLVARQQASQIMEAYESLGTKSTMKAGTKIVIKLKN